MIAFLLFCCHETSLLPSCWAQIEESVTPWRIEENAPVDFSEIEPLDLNTASYQDLLRIPGMTPDLAQSIITRREETGPFKSVDNLLTINGVNDEIFDEIELFLKVAPEDEAYNVSLIMRFQFQQPSRAEVEESPYRSGEKLAVGAPDHVYLGIVLEKDPGETDLWDYSAFSLQAGLPNKSGKVILGDYLAGFGAGLVIRTARNYGLNQHPTAGLSFYPQGLQTYDSWDENIALRGAALSFGNEFYHFDTWGSRRQRDAFTDSAGVITSFDESGLHRTDSEQLRQDACIEDAWGAHADFEVIHERLNLGVNVSSVRWDAPYLFDQEEKTQASAGGFAATAAGDYLKSELEVAWDQDGNGAQFGVLQMDADELRSSTALYYVAPDYFSPLASSLDFDLGEVHNREGVYSSLSLKSRRGYLVGFIHTYRFPRRKANGNWGGQDLFAGGSLTLGGKANLTLRSRWTQEEEPETYDKISRWRGSARLRIRPDPDWRIDSQAKFCRAYSYDNTGQMLSLSVKKHWDIGALASAETEIATGVYHAEAYALRLYWFEYDLSGSLRARPLWGDGRIVQITVTGRHRTLGSLSTIWLWDQPEGSTGDRTPSRTITVVFKYP